MNITLRDQDTSKSHHVVLPETNTLGKNTSQNQIPALDGIRALACLGVLTFHTTIMARAMGIWKPVYNIHDISGILAYLTGTLAYCGDAGVILFFVLSGFLLFLPYAKALLFESKWPSLRRFYFRRFFRILPGYYTVLFLDIAFFHPEYLRADHRHALWSFLTFTMSYNLSTTLNSVFWTLAIEFQFYILLPIIAWLFSLIVSHGTLHQRLLKLTSCLLLMMAWGLLTRYWGLFLAHTSKLDFLIPHSLSVAFIPYLYSDKGKFFEVFAIGMLAAMIYTYTQYTSTAESWHPRIRRLSPLLLTIGIVIFFCLSLCYFYFADVNGAFVIIFPFLDPHIPHMMYSYWEEWQYLLYALGFGLCLLALLYGSSRLKRPFEASLLRWVASISFSLYMWHYPFLLLFTHVVDYAIRHQSWNSLVQYAAFWCWILVIMLPGSAMLYRWIERPGIRLGEWLISKFTR